MLLPGQWRPTGTWPNQLTAADDQPAAIEDYALIGNCRSAALVGRSGSIDWLCWPRFDSAACFAALLGSPDNGRWLIAPSAPPTAISRRYRPDTMILETIFVTAQGRVLLTDVMAAEHAALIRIVEGLDGAVPMRLALTLRFEYGSAVPWVTRLEHGHGLRAIAGPDQVVLTSDTPLLGHGLSTIADFTVERGQRVRFVLAYGPSHEPVPAPPDAEKVLEDSAGVWAAWSARCTYRGRWHPAVQRSLLTLKALSYQPTGGIVAAPTTSLPEQTGGTRNWDYRFCWLRDASFTLQSLMHAGYREEAQAWGAWLRRSIAGTPAQVQTLYGLAGERWIAEREVPWLSGYQGAKPVRVGNAASTQLQIDVYGEVMDALFQEVESGLLPAEASWDLLLALATHLESVWLFPDESIWEVRGGPRHFTFSKVMAWVGLDRAVRIAERYCFDAPVAHWRAVRQQIHDTTCREGFNAAKNSFVQSFGADALDASLLLLPAVAFLPADDPRMRGTVAAIERELMTDGLVRRYRSDTATDGLPAGEGVFLACSFWYVDVLAEQGRRAEAVAMFERLLGLCNDVGLLAEEYDPVAKRQMGNFPQAFSHLALVNSALKLDRAAG